MCSHKSLHKLKQQCSEDAFLPHVSQKSLPNQLWMQMNKIEQLIHALIAMIPMHKGIWKHFSKRTNMVCLSQCGSPTKFLVKNSNRMEYLLGAGGQRMVKKEITIFLSESYEYLEFASDKLFHSLVILINGKHFSFLGSFFSVFEPWGWLFEFHRVWRMGFFVLVQ